MGCVAIRQHDGSRAHAAVRLEAAVVRASVCREG